MASVCDRCGAAGKVQPVFGIEVCSNCMAAIEKFAHTKINRSTGQKILHGLAVVGKKVAESSNSDGKGMKILDDKPDPQAKKWVE